ncbi:hypothetical protein KC323_g7076 [Hortaea werneckii]|uniref:C2 NT-type domain-containing protein n=1 Tax=Hortaea werneckii TaxID=91943 RepID=A0A3M7HYF5_HORWE|nr:hypothetical protein KC323_g7076 [Hortaea werneckii]RMZ18258.1 hypothetical protein D0862_00483 [Hortaea werneckii]
MTAPFIPKSRRVRFALTLHILDLNNVPLVSGSAFVKWDLSHSVSAEHRGRTPRCAIKDHRVLFSYSKSLPVRLTVGRDGVLEDCPMQFDILQEYSAGGKVERITLGYVRCNLAEYVEASEALSSSSAPPATMGSVGGSSSHHNPQGRESIDNAGGELGVVRRYLMQDSKINSTLKLGIYMRHTEGTRDFYAPPLRSAPVFGGIAGIIHSSEPVTSPHGAAGTTADGERPSSASLHPSSSGNGIGQDDPAGAHAGAIPSLSSSNREVGEMQDMYRRTLAAHWASQPGELKADECIEDIFSGGDGWGAHGRPPPLSTGDQSEQTTEASGSGASTPRDPHSSQQEDSMGSRRQHQRMGNVTRGIGSPRMMGHRYGRYGQKMKVPRKGAGELDEFEVREDLRSWTVGERAYG